MNIITRYLHGNRIVGAALIALIVIFLAPVIVTRLITPLERSEVIPTIVDGKTMWVRSCRYVSAFFGVATIKMMAPAPSPEDAQRDVCPPRS